jgi:hypothetical protein
MIRLIQSVGTEINTDIQNYLTRLTSADIATYTDYLCMVNYLQRYRIGVKLVDVVQEVGEEDDSSLSILVINTNGSGLAKPAVIYHTNPTEVDMTRIFEDTRERYRIYPDSIYPDADLVTKLESIKTLKSVSGVITQNDKDDLARYFSRLGFEVYFIMH